jgi:hypothetical protein
MSETMPRVNVCECGSTKTLWIECDYCPGEYDKHPHYFLACANCFATSDPWTEREEGN